MSTKWAYINNRGTGSITRIYCSENPSDENPSGEWIVVRRLETPISLKKYIR
jgi:hypothetical protein